MSNLRPLLRLGFNSLKHSSVHTLGATTKCAGATKSLGGLYTHQTRTMAATVFTDDIIKYLDDLHKVLVSDALVKGTKRDTKVVDFKQPEELQELLNLPVGKDGVSHEELLDICRKTIQYSVQTANPLFLNQLYSGRDPYSLSGAWTVEALNTNQHTYEVAPVFILVEKYITERVAEIVGFENGEGVFTPGGNQGNMLGFHLARYNSNKEIKQKGLCGSKPMVLYSSIEAHYSIKTGASFLGFGLDNVEYIDTDDLGRMRPDELEKAVKRNIEEGKIPLCVMATASTTVLGSFDPLNPIADVCEKYKLWLHVDGAWGGSVILSDKHKHLVDGINRADSVFWNAHKMINCQIQSSIFVTKHKGLLGECNSSHADYLYQPDKLYDVSWDRGDLSVQCGRKADAYKLWVMWKAHGDKGLAAIVDSHFDKAAYFTEKLKKTEGFRLVLPEFQSLNISFWYIPPSLRGKPETEEWWKEIGRVAPKIKSRMQLKGSVMVGYQPLAHKNFVNFWRLILSSTTVTHDDLDFVVEEIDKLGRDL